MARHLILATTKMSEPLFEPQVLIPELKAFLAGFVFELPELKHRSQDWPGLLQSFVSEQDTFPRRQGDKRLCLEAMIKYPFPGNVREMRSLVEASLAMSGHRPWQETFCSLLERAAANSVSDNSFRIPRGEYLTLKEFSLAYITWLLRECQGNIAEAARILKISRTRIYGLLRQR